nr:uncharacterized protein LOC119164464 [Rhipicephalus microplus]
MPFVCKLCDVAMNCEDAMIAHTKGKKHQKTLQREEILRQFASTKGSPLPSAVTSPLPSAVTSPLPLAVTSSPPTTSPPPPTTTPMSPPTSTMSEPPQEKQEQNGEVIDLSCRVCGIVLFEHVGYKLEHLETEAHRKKKMQVAGGQRLVTNNALNPQLGAEPCNR